MEDALEQAHRHFTEGMKRAMRLALAAVSKGIAKTGEDWLSLAGILGHGKAK